MEISALKHIRLNACEIQSGTVVHVQAQEATSVQRTCVGTGLQALAYPVQALPHVLRKHADLGIVDEAEHRPRVHEANRNGPVVLFAHDDVAWQ